MILTTWGWTWGACRVAFAWEAVGVLGSMGVGPPIRGWESRVEELDGGKLCPLDT